MHTDLGLALVVVLPAVSVWFVASLWILQPQKVQTCCRDGWAWLVTLCREVFTDADVQADARFTPPKLVDHDFDRFKREDEKVIYAFTFKK